MYETDLAKAQGFAEGILEEMMYHAGRAERFSNPPTRRGATPFIIRDTSAQCLALLTFLTLTASAEHYNEIVLVVRLVALATIDRASRKNAS